MSGNTEYFDKITYIVNQDDLVIINLLIKKFKLGINDRVVLQPNFVSSIALFNGSIYKNNVLVASFESDKLIKILGTKVETSLPWPRPTGINWFIKQLEKLEL